MSDADKPHEPSAHKLKKAREQGNVAKSREVVSAAVLTGGVLALGWIGNHAYTAQLNAWRSMLQSLRTLTDGHVLVSDLMLQSISRSMVNFAPIFAVIALVAVIGNMAQTGFVFAPEAISFKPDRLNVGEGLKRLASKDALFNAAKIVGKVSIIAWVAGWSVAQVIPGLGHSGIAGSSLPDLTWGLLGPLLFKLLLLVWIFALIDHAYTHRRYLMRLRMSKKELTDEAKQREGDPRIRSKRRELQRDARKRSQGLSNARGADVIITNPTHFAVALRYDNTRMNGPQLVAKGAGLLAKAIRGIGSAHSIPIVQNPRLARRIYFGTRVDREVDSSLFPELVRIYVWIYAMRRASAIGRAA